MKRRRLLASGLVGVAGIAGCLGSVDRLGGEDTVRPSEIVATDFETGVETEASVGDDPKIETDDEAAMVTVEGVGEYGSSSCGYLTDRPPSYDREHAELSLEVGTGREEPDEDDICGDDLAADSYRFVVEFDEGVPVRIEAEHPFSQTATKKTE
ncbi:hypothetical protein ACLI4U_08540 [Natrialbaceae archaeon A-CW2]|uniref:hypothetical protein n=1 Tax=Natronosalvus amylolyticus TaxID=2961994 RepID=UPI0020C99A0B|nr:hypothetical protein [Natronosalvus amylolyticus]